MNRWLKLYRDCRKSQSALLPVLLRYVFFRLRGQHILAHERAFFRGTGKIETAGTLRVGIDYVGFSHPRDVTLFNVEGVLRFSGDFWIGRGCRFDIGPKATVLFGRGYANPNSLFVIMESLAVGHGCAISWGCQFLDERFHDLDYPGKAPKAGGIRIGNNVWIGSGCTILRGARIPDGCVVAAGAVVGRSFEGERLLIGGNPARVLRQNVTWGGGAR
jgi:hypothetical protein